MKHPQKNTKQGIVSSIILIIVAIILIAYFRNDIKNFLYSTQFKDALLTAIGWIQQAFIWVVVKLGWASSQIK